MDHSVRYHELEGGARLMSINIPNAITFYWGSYFRAGFRFVPTDKYEMPHLAEHLAFSGTKSYPDDLLFKTEIERDGTAYNATTSTDHVDYFFIGSREELKRIIGLNMSQIYEQLFRKKEIAQEQSVIIQEMKRRPEDDNWRLSYEMFHQMIPKTNPEIFERIEKISTITKADLETYHAEYYGVANTRFILTGNYTGQELEDIVATLNLQLKGRNTGVEHQFEPYLFGDYAGKILTLKPHRPNQAAFGLRFINPDRDEKNMPALKLISLMLTGGLSSRLLRKAREMGLTYGIGTQAVEDDDYSIFSVSSQSSVDKIYPLVELSAKEVKAIRDGDYSDEELNHAKGFLAGSIRRGYQIPSQFAGWYSHQFLYGWEQESPEDWISKIQAVTRADIERAAKAYFKRSNSHFGMIGRDLDKETPKFDALLNKYFA